MYTASYKLLARIFSHLLTLVFYIMQCTRFEFWFWLSFLIPRISSAVAQIILNLIDVFDWRVGCWFLLILIYMMLCCLSYMSACNVAYSTRHSPCTTARGAKLQLFLSVSDALSMAMLNVTTLVMVWLLLCVLVVTSPVSPLWRHWNQCQPHASIQKSKWQHQNV